MISQAAVAKQFEIPETGACDPFAVGFMQAQARGAANELLREAFIASGLTKAELARRLGWDPSRVAKVINMSTNLTVETLGELIFAITGGRVAFSLAPLGLRSESQPSAETKATGHHTA